MGIQQLRIDEIPGDGIDGEIPAGQILEDVGGIGDGVGAAAVAVIAIPTERGGFELMAAQEYGEFLESGVPITFDVPKEPAPVISGLVLGDRVLVRRTDFGKDPGDVTVQVGEKTLPIPPAPNRCQVLILP